MVTRSTTTRRTTPTPLQRRLAAEDAKMRRYTRAHWDPDYYADPRNAYAASSNIMPGAEVQDFTVSEFNRAQIIAQASTIGPRAVKTMIDVLSGSPTVSPGVAASISQLSERMAIPQEIIDDIMVTDAQARAIDPALTGGRNPSQGSEAEKGGALANVLGQVTRPLFAMLSLPVEAVLGGIRTIVGDIADPDDPNWTGNQNDFRLRNEFGMAGLLGDIGAQTLGGQYVAGLADGPGGTSADLGEGFIPRGEVAARQAQAARNAAPLVFGHAWTLGRGVGSMIFDDPDSLAYQNLSGLIDLTANIVLDPTIAFGIGASAARGIRGGARGAAAVDLGRFTQAAATEREVINLAESAADYAERVGRLSEATLGAANDFARNSAATFTSTASRMANPAIADLSSATVRLDDLDDALAATRADLRSTKGWRTKTAQAQIDEAAAPVRDTEMAREIENLTTQLGDDGLDAMTAKVLGDSPELPGVFTDAIFAPNGRRSALPGADDGVDAVVRYSGPDSPNLRSVDDRIDNAEEIIAALKARKPRSSDRVQGINAVTELLQSPTGASFGNLLSVAESAGAGRALLTALRDSDIDGITDVFRLTGGEGGVWWTSRDMTVARWTENTEDGVRRTSAADGSWRVYDNSPSGLRARIEQIVAERKVAQADLTQAQHHAGASTRLAQDQARVYNEAMATRTAAADSLPAVRNAVEMAAGIRRGLGGKPEIAHDLLREFMFGPTNHFDSAIGANQAVPTYLRAAEVGNRATIAIGTLGVSEVARLGRKVVEPFAQRAREQLLSAMVRLDDTPQNLGLLQRMTNGKIDPQLLRGVLQAQDETSVLEVLGPSIGLDMRRPITPNIINSLPVRMSAVNGGRAQSILGRRAMQWMTDMAERAGSIVPRFGAHINLAEPQGSAITLRNYLNNLPGMSTQEKDLWVGRFLGQETEVGRARQIMKTMDAVSDSLTARNDLLRGVSDETKELMATALRRASRIYSGGREATNTWWLGKYANDANTGYVATDGKMIELPGPQLEAELARGGMVLPDIGSMRDGVGRWGAAVQAHPSIASTRNVLDHAMDFWRSAILFRLAYTARNIGEMQFRMFLAGHKSVFNDPVGAVAMASALNKRTATSRGLLARFTHYNKTASGRELGPVAGEDLDAYEDALEGYIDLVSRTSSTHDMRTMRAVEMSYDLRPVGVGQPGFNEGWAEELIKLRSSFLARIAAGYNPKGTERAIASGANRESVIIEWLMNSPSARSLRREYEESESLAPIWADQAALRQFVFDGKYSIRARVQEYTAGGNPDLVNFIATGELMRGGESKFIMSTRHVDAAVRQDVMTQRSNTLGRALKDYVGEMPDDYSMRMRVLRGDKSTVRSVSDRVFDGFFGWNGRKENAWAMGPEFSYAFNDTVVDLMPAMTAEARAEAFAFVKAAQGRYRPLGEVMLKARAAMKAEPGTLNMADVERAASAEATDKVKGLFYDARDRRQIFHQLRLALPFAQPFFDTLWHWGRLAAARPYMMEKIGRLGQGLSEQGSGVIYDDFDWIDPFTDRESRDPTQGFIYRDPATGEQRFSFPLIGSVLGAAISPFAGFNAAEAMQLSAPVENLNLAFQGDVDYLPGVGPLISLPMSQLMPDDWYGSAPEWFRKYIFPFGEPNLEGGLIESTFLPSWARRLTGALYSEDFRAYSYKPLMAYFVSNKEYPGLRSDPAMQAQLVDDVQQGSRWLTFIRALGAAILPAAPTQEIYAADEDGRLIGTVYLADRFNHLRTEAGGDYEQATQAFIDTYGMQAIGALLPSTEGDTSITGPAWEFYKKHPSEAAGYTDVLGDFFPGDFSYEAQRFQESTNSRRRLSVDERTDVLISYLYDAEKVQLEGRAAQEGWDVKASEAAEEDLERSYGGVRPTFTGMTPADRLDRLRRALEKFPELAETRGGQGAELIFDAYDQFTEESQRRYGTGLSGEKAEGLRNQFLDQVDGITQEFGGMNEADGSVHTIARRFVSAVTPRG